MRLDTTPITFKKGKLRIFNRLKALAIIIAALGSLSFSTQAKIYTANLDGIYNDPNIWVPSYPGNIIKETDTVYINNHVKLNTDIVIKGTLLVRRTGTFTGEKNIVLLPEGTALNFGILIAQNLNNKGLVYNNHIIEIMNDLINSGQVINQQSMVIGNITDNIGLITGQGGSLTSNNRIVNSQTGSLRGNIDVCSNNFMNVDGGTIDSTKLSFCGLRIFSNVFLSADIRRDNIILNLKNAENKDYKKIQVERSVDGVNYITIATVNRKPSEEQPFRYEDHEVLKSNSVFYRLKAIGSDDSETTIQAVEVGNAAISDIEVLRH